MPTGQKTIVWTPDNETKLFKSILVVHDIKIDYDAVAKEFGSGLTGATIARYMYKFRSKSKKMGQTLGSTPVGSLSAPQKRSRATTTINNAKNGKKGAKGMQENSDDESVNDEDEDGQAATPPKTPIRNNNADKVLAGRVTKARVSPRKTMKKNYKMMVDPFNDMQDATDETGERIFAQEKSDSEDSYPTDVEFGQERRVKVKEEPMGEVAI